MLELAKEKSPFPLVYEDRDNGTHPICLDCFLRRKTELTAPDALAEWKKVEKSACAQWEKTPAEVREQRGFGDPHGWVKLLLYANKWPQVTGRCWTCSRRLALSYRLLIEEMRGAKQVRDFCERCRVAAAEANSLSLEIEATEYRPEDPNSHDLRSRRIQELAQSHAVSLQALLAEPGAISVEPIQALLEPRLRELLCGNVDIEHPKQIRYSPLELGYQTLREIAVVLRQTADMSYVSELNFAGVVEAHAKDPYNPPERLALVVAYQWAQDKEPQMGYAELARILIEHGVADAHWGGDAKDLAETIRAAVKKYRPLGRIKTARS